LALNLSFRELTIPEQDTSGQAARHAGESTERCMPWPDWILPKEERLSMYEIGPYEAALRYSKVRANRPDVTLSVKIVHRRGFDQPVDECEMRCLREMKEHLSQLGACERQWSLRMASTA